MLLTQANRLRGSIPKVHASGHSFVSTRPAHNLVLFSDGLELSQQLALSVPGHENIEEEYKSAKPWQLLLQEGRGWEDSSRSEVEFVHCFCASVVRLHTLFTHERRAFGSPGNVHTLVGHCVESKTEQNVVIRTKLPVCMQLPQKAATHHSSREERNPASKSSQLVAQPIRGH